MFRKVWRLSALPLVLLLACSSDSTLNGNKLAQQMQRGIEKAGVKLKKIHCPQGRALKLNDTFDCTAESTNGKAIKVQARQINDKGNVTWEVTSGLIDTKTVRDDITSRYANGDPPVEVKVTCPSSKAIAVAEGDTFECKAENPKDANDFRTVRVTVKPGAATFDWAPV